MNNEAIQEQIQDWQKKVESVFHEISKSVVGQRHMVERLLMGFLVDGHILVEGVPGLAKTRTVKALAKIVQASFQRIQFTPDLLPADVLGTQIYNPKTQEFSIKKGPLFHNIILADEINRAPAKVQSALLEAMQEKQITIGEETFKLEEPFVVLATQNPIEQEGTYPLPEAQVDRFMFKVNVGYPSPEEEQAIVNMVVEGQKEKSNPVLTPEDLVELRKLIQQIYMDPKINDYIVRLIFATRDPKSCEAGLENYIQFGASPRASINLNLAARAQAFLQGRAFVIPEDVKIMAPDVLRHRVILSFEAEAEALSADDILKKILDQVEVP